MRQANRFDIDEGMRIRWMCEDTGETHEGLVTRCDKYFNKSAEVQTTKQWKHLDLLRGGHVTILEEFAAETVREWLWDIFGRLDGLAAQANHLANHSEALSSCDEFRKRNIGMMAGSLLRVLGKVRALEQEWEPIANGLGDK